MSVVTGFTHRLPPAPRRTLDMRTSVELTLLLRKGIVVTHLTKLKNSPAVLGIIAAMSVLFVAQAVDSSVVGRFSLHTESAALGDRPWTPLTVMFLHDNLLHFAAMVLMLSAFGVLLEGVVGARAVVATYLLSGLAGSLGAIAIGRWADAEGSLVGASAAVFGVAAAVLVRQPSVRLFGGTATQWLAVLVGINIVFLVAQPLSSVAHLAGLAVGVACGRWLSSRAQADSRQRVG